LPGIQRKINQKWGIIAPKPLLTGAFAYLSELIADVCTAMKKELVFFLIDDDKDDIEIFDLALKQTEHSVRLVSTNNGNDAIKMFESDKTFIPDFIFLDLDMPVMDGRACFREIKKLEHLKKIPVYFYTTSPHLLENPEFRLSGTTLFFFKPSYIQELIAFLKNVINKNNPLTNNN
jgi:CheY-like chemotaxis protein